MITQDVSALPTFNPHGGPITHSSTGSKPDSPVPPLYPRLFLARGLVCNSWATFNLVSDKYLFSWLRTPFTPHIRHRTIACPLETSQDTSLLCSLYFLKFQFESYFRHPPRCYRPDSQTCRGPFSRDTHPLSFRKYDGTPKKGRQTSSWWPEGEDGRHQCNGSTSSRRVTKTEKTH